jgi:alginate O-acetyltransferase complex protein AlgI
MIFANIEFTYFVAAILAAYWLLPRRAPIQNAWLLGASYLFYVSWDFRLISLVIAGTLLDFYVTRRVSRSGTSAAVRKYLLAASLSWNLGALGFFKYEGFFADSLNALALQFGLPDILPHLRFALPLGISFYTLQRLSYVLDVYWGRQHACTSILQFALFSCYFPQITAGPISRGGELLPQLALPRYASPGMFRKAGMEILVGFALKAWASELIGSFLVDPVYAAPGTMNPIAHLAALVGYPLQVFADFAGYSLIAIGISRLFGVELPINFNFPFLSKSLPELWRRWHITLNRWLFDYIFTPVTTSRGWMRGRFNVALMLTFLGSGIWHGANWTYVAWGLMHGTGMVVHWTWDEFFRRLCRADRRWVQVRTGALYGFVAWSLTIGFFVVSLVLFRASSLSDAWSFARGLIGAGNGWHTPSRIDELNVALACLFIAAYHFAGTKRGTEAVMWFGRLPSPIRAATYAVAIAFLLVFCPVSPGTFIYQQF